MRQWRFSVTEKRLSKLDIYICTCYFCQSVNALYHVNQTSNSNDIFLILEGFMKRKATSSLRNRVLLYLVGLMVIVVAGGIGFKLYGDHLRTTPVSVLSGDAIPNDSLPNATLLDSAYLSQFVSDPCLSGPIQDIIRKMPKWNQLVANAWGQADGLEIDVILQEHQDLDGTVTPSIRRSQSAIKSILEREGYLVVGMEGTDLMQITLETMFKHQKKFVRDLGLHIPDRDVREMVATYFESNGGTRYVTRHPEAVIFGCDAESLLTAHGCFLTPAYTDLRGRPVHENLRTVLGVTRSQIALVKTILMLRHHGQTRGVIIIGSFHRPELEFFLRMLHIKSKVYDTTL